MPHVLPALALLALVACGDASTSTTASATPASEPTDDRRALSVAQLAVFFPAEVNGRRASIPDARNVKEYRDGWTGLYATYADPADASPSLRVSVRDYVDRPSVLAESRRKATEPAAQYEDGYGADREESRVLDDGTLAEETEHDEDSGRRYASLFLVVGDRFEVALTPSDRSEPTLDDLWAFYHASGLARLANAPLYADAAPAEMPAWTRDDAPSTAPPPAAAALPACDVVLPLSEVERVCNVSGLRVGPTPFLEEGPTACNRRYSFPRNLSGLDVIVSRYTDAATARSAQGLAADVDDARERRQVPGLGDAATGHVKTREGARTTERVLSIATGADLVEMTSVVMADEPGAEVCTLDQLETLAQGVVERLRN